MNKSGAQEGISQQRHVSKTEFKAHAFELFRQIEASRRPLIVTDNGRPVLEIRPYRPIERDPSATLRGSVVSFDNPMDPVGEEEWQLAR